MAKKFLASVRRRLHYAAYPTARLERRVTLELFQLAAQGIRKYKLVPYFGALCAVIALAWAPWQMAAGWYAVLMLYRILHKYLRTKVPGTLMRNHHLQRIWFRMTSVELVSQLLWLLYVPMCWHPGDAANNAFLILYMLASVCVAMHIYGPCIQITIPTYLLHLPFVAIYTMHTGAYADVLMPLAQVAFLCLLGVFTLNHYRIFTQTVRQRLTIQALVRDLAKARDASEQENRAKSAFLASMSHELRTPMNAIIGFSDMIRQEILGPIAPEKYREYAEDIYTSGQHLLALINDVLDLSKIEAGKRELANDPVDLSGMAYDAIRFVELQADKKHIAIDADVAPGVTLCADERALRQILVNLLSNAIKFSADGETVTLFAKRTPQHGLTLGVCDRGIGMDAEGINKALEPYGQIRQTTRNSDIGTGLGLPIARALIEAHGAAFHIESAIGVGTTVWGEFPRQRIQVKAA